MYSSHLNVSRLKLAMSDIQSSQPSSTQSPTTTGCMPSDTESSDSPKNRSTGVDLLRADVFHISDEKREKIPWIKLEKEARVQKLKEYFEREFNNSDTEKTIDKNTIDMLLDIAGKGQLRLKKEVSYDEVNQRVIKLAVITVEPHTDHYIYKPETLSQREKSRKSARSKLFRRHKKR